MNKCCPLSQNDNAHLFAFFQVTAIVPDLQPIQPQFFVCIHATVASAEITQRGLSHGPDLFNNELCNEHSAQHLAHYIQSIHPPRRYKAYWRFNFPCSGNSRAAGIPTPQQLAHACGQKCSGAGRGKKRPHLRTYCEVTRAQRRAAAQSPSSARPRARART